MTTVIAKPVPGSPGGEGAGSRLEGAEACGPARRGPDTCRRTDVRSAGPLMYPAGSRGPVLNRAMQETKDVEGMLGRVVDAGLVFVAEPGARDDYLEQRDQPVLRSHAAAIAAITSPARAIATALIDTAAMRRAAAPWKNMPPSNGRDAHSRLPRSS